MSEIADNLADTIRDEPTWATAHADEQTPASSLGLLRWHTMAVEQSVRAYFEREDGDE